MRSLADTIIIMPSVANSKRTGNSKRSMFSRRMKPSDMISVSPAPTSTRNFMKMAKSSTTNNPSKVVVVGDDGPAISK